VSARGRMGRFLAALRLVWTVQWKTGFPVIYGTIAVATIAALRLTLLFDYRELLLPAIQLGEYGTISLSLVAAHRYLERNEKSEVALAVTPLRRGEYVAALVLGSALVPTVTGVAVQALALGPDTRLLFLSLPLMLTATVCGLFAVVLSARYAEFTSCLMGGLVPATIVLSLPFLSYFEVLPRIAFVWLPTDASLFAFANAVSETPSVGVFAVSVGVLLLWNAIAIVPATRAFDATLRASTA
jgi:hypothetical protein